MLRPPAAVQEVDTKFHECTTVRREDNRHLTKRVGGVGGHDTIKRNPGDVAVFVTRCKESARRVFCSVSFVVDRGNRPRQLATLFLQVQVQPVRLQCVSKQGVRLVLIIDFTCKLMHTYFSSNSSGASLAGLKRVLDPQTSGTMPLVAFHSCKRLIVEGSGGCTKGAYEMRT